MNPPTASSEPEPERAPRVLKSRYSAIAVEWIVVALFAGLVAAILGIAAALVYWAWTA